MLIHIQSPDTPNLHIPIPNRLLLNRLTLHLLTKKLAKKAEDSDILQAFLSDSALVRRSKREILREVRTLRRRFGKLELVHVETDDGTNVRIVL